MRFVSCIFLGIGLYDDLHFSDNVLLDLMDHQDQSLINLYRCLQEIHGIESATFGNADISGEVSSCSFYPFESRLGKLFDPIETISLFAREEKIINEGTIR